eukprot:TRINITY_DN1190_c0_g1_i1.p1 TRINITY_DN1190_c0_g1~~TRINITY_DN1190_c0_g1_i1.p1  ORF type:complete len:403 (+),score=53.83 TRINITY_DN1190_c0_g1_i1:32-1210(+)
MKTLVLSLALLSLCVIPSSFAYYVVQQSFLIEASCQGASFYKNIQADNCFRGAQVNTNYIYNCTTGSTYTCSIYVYNGNDCVTSFASKSPLPVGSCSDGSFYTRSDNLVTVTSSSGSFLASGLDPAGNKCSPSVIYSVPLSPACVALDPNVGAYIYTCDTTTANQTRTTQCNNNQEAVYTLSKTCGSSSSFAITDAGPCATLPVATTTSAFAAATSRAAVSTSTSANSAATSARSVSTSTVAAQSTAGRAADVAASTSLASTTSANTVTTSTFARSTSTAAANVVTLSGASTSTSQVAATTNALRISTTAQANTVTTSTNSVATSTASVIATNSAFFLSTAAVTTSQSAATSTAAAAARTTTTGRVNDASTLIHKASLVPLGAFFVVLAVMF